jgi:hypothetical protein
MVIFQPRSWDIVTGEERGVTGWLTRTVIEARQSLRALEGECRACRVVRGGFAVPDSPRRWEGDLAVHCDFCSRVQMRLWFSAWFIGFIFKVYLMFGVARRVVETRDG